MKAALDSGGIVLDGKPTYLTLEGFGQSGVVYELLRERAWSVLRLRGPSGAHLRSRGQDSGFGVPR